MNKNIKMIMTVIGIGVISVLVLNTLYKSYMSDRSDTSYRSDTPVFSSTAPVIISLGISVAEAASLPQGIALIESNINITGPRGERINEKVNLNLKPQENGEYGLVMNPKDEQSFTPGKYSISADIQTKKGIRHIEQNFLWGVLAINPNKSVYRPRETAHLSLAVLDERGMMVCDAEVELEIRAPDKTYMSYKTYKSDRSNKTNTIRVNEECYQKKVTERPDYETEYRVSDPGTYQMTLTATTKNGTYTIEDWFEVRALRQAQGDNSVMVSSSNHFDIERITATRIYPVHEYPVVIRVTPEEDFRGTVTETTPEFFGVRENRSDKSDTTYRSYKTYRSGMSETADRSDKVIAWDVEWKAGETYELSYIYKSPEISPQFYLLGPLRLYRSDMTNKTYTTYMEPRQWQIAVDAAPQIVGSATSSRTSNDTADSVTLPASIAAGDLIIVFHFSDSDGTQSVTFPGSWVEMKDVDNATPNAHIAIGYLIASGGETSVTITKNLTERFTAVAIRISAASWHGTTPPEVSTGATGNSANPNPDTVTASWGSDDNLFIAVNLFDNSAGGGSTSAWPTNYSSNNLESPDISSAARGAIGTRELTSASDDPGTFTISTDQWWAGTVVVRPAAAGGSAPTITSVTDSPDPATALRSTVSFSTDWNDADGGETIKVKICKTNSLTSQNCDGGYWATSSAFTTTDPEVPTYNVEGSAVGSQSYYAFVCDDDGNCSSSTSGTFTVNATTVPNVKFR